MKNRKSKSSQYSRPRRLSFPSDEQMHHWLPLLLDAYCLVDRGVSDAVQTELRKGRKLACGKGCSHCCRTHQTIPVYPLELVGISWYVTEKVTGPLRETIKNQLINCRENDPCPFLIDGACAVHAVRPAACRQFNVFQRPCGEGEDPYYTRREDVLVPIKKYLNRAFFVMLPFYGIEDETQRLKIIESGTVHQVVKLLQTCNWKSLAEKMNEYEKRSSGNKR